MRNERRAGTFLIKITSIFRIYFAADDTFSLFLLG